MPADKPAWKAPKAPVPGKHVHTKVTLDKEGAPQVSLENSHLGGLDSLNENLAAARAIGWCDLPKKD